MIKEREERQRHGRDEVNKIRGEGEERKWVLLKWILWQHSNVHYEFRSQSPNIVLSHKHRHMARQWETAAW